MKKNLAYAVSLLLLTCPLFAITNQELAETVNKKVNTTIPQNKGAINNNLRVDFGIYESFYDERMEQDNGPFEADIACKAYALDENWLILSGTCMRLDTNDIREPGDHVYMKRHSRKLRTPINHAENDNVMLIWNATKKNQAPFVNVLATSSPNVLFSLNATHTIKINTARGGLNAVKERKLKTGSVSGKYFKLNEGPLDLSGTATDPLFLISPNKNEFLAGYNNGFITYALQMTIDDILHTYDGRPSDTWFALTKEDLFFIKNTVLKNRPADWPRIKKHLFFDTTKQPFFTK